MQYDLEKYVNKSSNDVNVPLNKLKLLHYKWVDDNKEFGELVKKGNDCFDTVMHRFKSNMFYLEVLWIQYEHNLKEGVENPESFNFLSLTLLESFIIQARSFIESTQNYTLLLLNIEKKSKNGLEGFYKLLEKSQDKKAKRILNLYKEKVDKENFFGDNIRKIRDKIIHYGYIKQYDFEDEIKNSKPLISNRSYEEFCQSYQNDLFYFMIDWSETLFEKKWQSG